MSGVLGGPLADRLLARLERRGDNAWLDGRAYRGRSKRALGVGLP